MKKKDKNKKTVRTILFVFYLAISYYCFSIQGKTLYATILPEHAYLWIIFAGCAVVSLLIYLCIREKKKTIAPTRAQKITIDIIAEGATFFVSVCLSIPWMPVCLVLMLKLNATYQDTVAQASFYRIENTKLFNLKSSRNISPNYLRLTLHDTESDKTMQLYLPPNISIRHEVTHVELVYSTGIFGWHTLQQKPQFYPVEPFE